MIFKYVLLCPENIPSKMRTQTESVSTDVESILWDDKTCLKSKYSMCWLQSPESPDSTASSGIQPGKKKKWIRFSIKWNEESWNNLVKGTQVPVARVIIIHESPWFFPFSPRSPVTSDCIVCTICTMCTIIVAVHFCAILGTSYTTHWPSYSSTLCT